MTPYQLHATLGHHMTRFSPNGVETIEECDDCLLRFQHSPAFAYPITLYPTVEYSQKWHTERTTR